MTVAPMRIPWVSAAILIVLMLCGCGARTEASATAHPSPTSDSRTREYVALIHRYWIQEEAADVATNSSNVAAKVCLGIDPPGAATNLQLVDPAACHERAVAILANAKWFLAQLDQTPAPPKFAQDDQAFRGQLPKAITDLMALIAAADVSNKIAVVQAATAYNDDMYPMVTDALNDVDPSVKHP